MKKKIELFMAFLLLIGAIVASKKLSELVEDVSSKNLKKEEVLIVIDPGHGGEDPGKVGVNDALEKDINLKIAEKLRVLLEDEGIQVVMTREDDFVPESKKEDLQKRVELIREVNPDIVVCVHQNSFTDQTVAGPQVFYHGDSEISKKIAQTLQEELWLVDEENKREIKGNESYFMLSETKVPTVIVECGFLSNLEESKKLVDDTYQQKLAWAIHLGILQYLNGVTINSHILK